MGRRCDGSGGYVNVRDCAVAVFGSRKNTRAWGAVMTGLAGLPRRSLDGLRKSVLKDDSDRPTLHEQYPGLAGSPQLVRWHR